MTMTGNVQMTRGKMEDKKRHFGGLNLQSLNAKCTRKQL